jgi:putative ABC transport system permease protein
VRVADRLVAAIIRLYPAEFRERFGREMTAVYREAREAAAMSGRREAAGFWFGLIGDALFRAPGEHMRLTLDDLRHAARTLRRAPVFTLVAIATLVLGIGATTAIFSVVNAVALQPFPVREPDRIVRLWEKNDKLGIPRFSASVPNYVSWRERVRLFEELAAWRSGSATLTSGGDPLRVARLQTTANVLPLLGMQPLAGRGISADEDRPGGPRVALLAETLWRSRFGGDPQLIGQAILLDGLPHTVIGVVRDRDLVSFQVLTPLAANLAEENRSNHTITVLGRLRPGVSLAQAQQEMDGIALALGKEYPKDDLDWGVTMATLHDWLVPENTRTGLYILLAAVSVVLLIACSNIANLSLARAALRRREQAVRLALGASRGRVVREVLTESMLLALVGGAGGVLLAYWLTPLFRTQLATVLPRADQIAMNTRVLFFAMAVSVFTGLLFGAIPALFNSRRDVIDALKEGGRTSGGRREGLARRVLVIGQLALATVLLAGAALLVQSFTRLQRVDVGFQPSQLTTAAIGLPPARYANQSVRWQFYTQVVEQLRAMPGIEAVDMTSGAPLAGGGSAQPIRAEGKNALGDKELQADWRLVGPGFFATMKIPVVRGRAFAMSDGEGGEQVIIVSTALTRRLWPDEDPIGRIILVGRERYKVVGVVGDVRSSNQAIDPRPTTYFSAAQFVSTAMTLVIRANAGAPVAALLRKVVGGIDPQLAVYNVRTMDTLLANGSAQPRVTAWLVGTFAALALLLAALGVYGVLAYLVTQRTREIGVRLALGARPASVLRLVVGFSLRLSGIGVLIGTAAAIALGPTLESQLFGVKGRDAVTLAVVPIALVALAVLASYIPARRATRVDPLVALRVE